MGFRIQGFWVLGVRVLGFGFRGLRFRALLFWLSHPRTRGWPVCPELTNRLKQWNFTITTCLREQSSYRCGLPCWKCHQNDQKDPQWRMLMAWLIRVTADSRVHHLQKGTGSCTERFPEIALAKGEKIANHEGFGASGFIGFRGLGF